MHSLAPLAAAIAVALPLFAAAQDAPPEIPPATEDSATGTTSNGTTGTTTDGAAGTAGTTTGTTTGTDTGSTTEPLTNQIPVLTNEPMPAGDSATTTTTIPPGGSATTTTTTTTTPNEPPPPPTPPEPIDSSTTNTNTNVGTNVNNNTNTSSSTSTATNTSTTTNTGTMQPPQPVIIPPAANTGTLPVPPVGANNTNNNQATANVIVRNENRINNTFSVQLQNAVDRALRQQSLQDYQQKVQQAQTAPQSAPPPALVYWTPGAPYWAVPHCTDIQHRTVASIMRHALDRDVGLIVASGRDACFYQPFEPRGICEWYIDLGCQRERLEREMQTINPFSK